jgi:hypothetical protein
MAGKLKYKMFVLVSLFMGITAAMNLETNWLGVSYAQTAESNLIVRLSIAKETYLQLEPVPLTFKVSNPTSQTVKWQGVFTFGSDMDLIVQPVGGEEKIIEGRSINTAALASAPISMQPGQEIASGAVIDGVNFFEKTFPSPGVYKVRVKFRYEKIDGDDFKKETVLSNPVTITVTAPQGSDFVAYNYLKNTLEKARRERASTEELIALQRNFVDSYGATVYGKNQIWKLALTYRSLGEDLKAARELCKIANDNTYCSKQVQQALYSIDIKLHPPDLRPLPEDAPLPVRPHPCSRLQD